MEASASLPWAAPAPPAPEAAAAERLPSVGSKIEVLWQLVDDGDNEASEEQQAAATAKAPEEEGAGGAATTAAAAATTTTKTTADPPAPAPAAAPARKDPLVVWWAATVKSVQGGYGGEDSGRIGPLRATLRYEAKPELGFDSETAVVEFLPPLAPSSSSSPNAGDELSRELRNVGKDGQLSDEVALPWRFFGEGDDEEEEGEEVEEEEEEEEDELEMERALAAAAAAANGGGASGEISAADLEKTLSAQLNHLERATGLKAEAAGAAALLAGAGGSSQRAAEVALRFEAFGEALKNKLAAAARANGGAALGAEEVREAVKEARRSSGNGGRGGV